MIATTQATEIIQTSIVPASKSSHRISEATYVATMTSAFISSKYVLLQEMATCLSVYYEHSNVSRDAKQMLMRIYNQAGFSCSSPEMPDYKSCSRRLNVGALLYTHLGHELIGKWCENKMEMSIISGIVDGLEPYAFTTIDGILAFVGRVRATPKPRTVAPSPEGHAEAERIVGEAKPVDTDKVALAEHIAKEQARVGDYLTAQYEGRVEGAFEFLPEDQMGPPRRRASDAEVEGAVRFDTENIHVTIPPDVTRDEVLKMALELMALVNSMNGAITVGEVPKDVIEEIIQEPAEKVSVEVDEEDLELIKEHQRIEEERMLAEQHAAKAKPLAQSPAPSRYRGNKPVTKTK